MADEKIVDMGKKIGGARKDFAKKSLSLNDLADMNDVEREKYVTRDNIWAFDAEEAVKNGMLPGTALWIKDFRRLFTKPVINPIDMPRIIDGEVRNQKLIDKLRANNDVNLIAFINVVTLIKDSFANVKTKKDLSLALAHIRKNFTETRYADVEFGDFENQRLQFKNWSSIRSIINQISYSEEDHVANWWHVNTKANADIEYGMEKLFPVRDNKKTEENTLLFPDKPNLEKLNCTHFSEKNPEDLLSNFGFAGVEFGNWLPNKERQQVVSHAVTAFEDLALALNIDPQDISLNGKLSTAFGSRGTRGGIARYDHGRKVIALTRLKGAGCIAHEYGHALDNEMGNMINQTYLTHSENAYLNSENKLIAAWAELRHVISCKQDSEQAKEKVLKSISLCFNYSASWLRPVFMYANKNLPSEFHAEVGEIVNRVINQEKQALLDKLATLNSDLSGNSVLLAYRDFEPKTLDILNKIESACKHFDITLPKDAKNNYVKIDAQTYKAVSNNLRCLAKEIYPYYVAANNRESTLNQVDSDFMQSAKKLDKGKSQPYWATPIELFARGFEQYVFYKLKALNIDSEYLVHSVSAENFSDARYIGNPYPNAIEQPKIYAAFDKFMNVAKQEMGFKSHPNLIAENQQSNTHQSHADFLKNAEQASLEFSFS